MKNVMRIMLLLLFSIFLVSCGDVTVTLDTPQNVVITNGVVTWDAVTGADSYVVVVDSNSQTVTVTTFDLKTLTLTAGDHTVQVVAQSGTEVSLPSTTLNYTVQATSLGVPQNVVIANGVVTWNAVTGATAYVVHVGSATYEVTVRTYNLNALGLSAGSYTIFITAKAGTSVSTASLSVTFTVGTANINTIYIAALSSMNPTYTPNMTEDDFEYEEDYQNYMMMSQLAYAYSETAAQMGMTEIQAISMIARVVTTPQRMQLMNNVSGVMDEIDFYSLYGMTSAQIANMIYELALVGAQIHMDDLVIKIDNAEQNVIAAQAELASVQAAVDLSAIRNELAVYASPEQIVMLDYFLTGAYEDTYFVLDFLEQIANDMRWNYEYHYPYYLDYGDEYIEMFYNIFDSVRVGGNTTLLEQFINNYPLNQVAMLQNYYMSIMWATEDFDGYTNELATFTEILAFMGTDKTMVVNSLIGVIDYLSLVYDTIPTSLVTLVDNLAANGELTMPEYITLKNEVVDVLLTTLPSEDDFAGIYTMLFTLGNTVGLADFTDYFAYTSFLGEVDHAVIELGLTFIADIDQTTVEDVMAIVDGMVMNEVYPSSPKIDYYNMERVQPNVDFEKVIELVVYVGNYIETFKVEHATMFANLTALQADAQVEELILLFGETAKVALESEMDPDQYAMVEMVIDEILGNYDTFMMAADVVNAVGMGVVDEFLATSGSMLLDLYELVNTGSGDLTDTLFVTALQNVISQMTDYAGIITTELDSDSIHKLLSVAMIGVKIELMMVSDLDPADIDSLIDLSLVPATAALDIAFTMIGYLDDQTIMDMIDLINQMIIPGEYVEEPDGYGGYYGYYESDSLDFPAAVEFAVYLGTFLQDFKTDNTAKLETFNSLFTDGDIEALLTLLSTLALQELETEMTAADFDTLTMFFADVLADYDDIIAAGAFVKTIGANLLDEFLITEGAMFLNLYTLMNDPLLNTDDPQFILDLMDIFGQVVNYNSAIMSEMDAISIEQLLRIVKIPLKVEMMQNEGMTDVEYEAFFEALVGPVSTVLANIATVEQALVASLDGMALTIAASATWVNLTEEQKVMALAVKTIDTVLDAHEALIFTTITIIQNDILKNANVLVMITKTAAEIDLEVADTVLMLTDIFDEVDVVADFNFLLITPEQIIQLNDLFAMLPSGETPPA